MAEAGRLLIMKYLIAVLTGRGVSTRELDVVPGVGCLMGNVKSGVKQAILLHMLTWFLRNEALG